MGSISKLFSKVIGDGGNALGGGDAARASLQGSQTAAQGDQNAIDFLQSQNKLPVDLQQAAYGQLGSAYGLPGFGTAGANSALTSAQNSPIFKAMQQQIMQGLQDNQNQAGASASANGLLGSGVLGDALAKYRARAGVDTSNALGQVYQQQLNGLTGITQMPTQSGSIAQYMAQKGMTLGQGVTAAGQDRLQANQAFLSDATSAAGGGAVAFSDIRLKSAIKFAGKIGRHNWYSWVWNEAAGKLGLKGSGEGVMAHEVEKYAPHAIGESNGYMTVNYNAI